MAALPRLRMQPQRQRRGVGPFTAKQQAAMPKLYGASGSDGSTAHLPSLSRRYATSTAPQR
jgi:hypothetical protein